jgi:hypothetical protein
MSCSDLRPESSLMTKSLQLYLFFYFAINFALQIAFQIAQ